VKSFSITVETFRSRIVKGDKKMKFRTRPMAVVGVAATAVCAVTVALGGLPATASSDAIPDPTTASLRDLAQHTKLRIGTAVAADALVDDATYRAAVGEQFSSVTPENVMKWETVEPEQGTFDFSAGDDLIAYAQAHQQKVRGHVLVWHSQLPAWLTEGTWTKAELRAVLKKHIQATAGHYKGKIWAWDVVNEAFNEDGTLRDTLWSRVLGPDFIKDAFVWAHQADPKAILFYNDYNIEGVNPKSTAVYNLVKSLRRQGVPVQGVGVQGHLGTQYDAPPDMLQNLQRFADLGVDTAVTEADVRSVLPMDSAKRQAQAYGYSMMLTSCLLVRSCISYTVWGFTDKYQWVPGVFDGEGSAAIYDENFVAKPAYDALRQALALSPTLRGRGF
jgi:endo-1,4-beta-xylanase